MSTPLALFLVGAPVAFWLGWFARGAWDRGGSDMAARARSRMRPLDRLFEWFAEGNRLIGFSLFCGIIGLGAFVYTWTADQQSEDRTAEVVRCVAEYIDEQNAAQEPRTKASIIANDARYAWDLAPAGAAKDRLRDEYKRAYEHYVDVRTFNPLPSFSLANCEEAEHAR